MLFFYIFGPIVFTAFIIFALMKVRQYRAEIKAAAEKQAKQDKTFYDLLHRAKKGERRAQDQLVDGGWGLKDPERNPEITAFLEENREVVKTRREQEATQRKWETFGEPAMGACVAWREAVGTRNEPELLAKFARTLADAVGTGIDARLITKAGFSSGQAIDLLRKVVRECYRKLTSEILESKSSFHQLRRLIVQTGELYGDFRQVGIEPLVRPEGWNEAVARFLKNPALDDFVHGGDPEPGQVRLWGEEALRTSDITTAKLVLAYANHPSRYYDWREELGDVLTHELGKLANKYNASLATEASAPVEPVEPSV